MFYKVVINDVYAYVYIYVNIYIYIYMCVCMLAMCKNNVCTPSYRNRSMVRQLGEGTHRVFVKNPVPQVRVDSVAYVIKIDTHRYLCINVFIITYIHIAVCKCVDIYI